jgi:AraC-like DNA-binding protein
MLIAKGKKHLFLPDVCTEGWMFDFGEDFLDDDASWVFSDFLAAPNLPLRDELLVRQGAVLAKLLWDLGQVAREETRPAVRHLLAAFLHLLQARIREQAVRAQPQNSADFKLFQAFLPQLDKSFQEEKEVEFYAHKLRCTTRRLGAACKAVLGKTPQTIVIERVMLEAKRLLLHSDMSVQQIAAILGCEEHSNFTKAFRKATGETPSAFRRARQLASAT